MAESSAAVFTGVGVALLTLLKEDSAVDAKATGELAADLVRRGVQGVLACGTTGQPATLTDAERREVSAARAAELTVQAVDSGAQAILAWPPPGSEDLPGYYAALVEAAQGLPVLAYHIPWISAPGVPVEALADLPIAGLKDSSGDPNRMLAEVARYRGWTYTGSSALLSMAGPMGGTGAILSVANLEPELCIAAFGGDGTAQRDLADVHLAAQAGGAPAVKRILAERTGSCALSRA
jgi:4-hydroxy-tetrahydrodipicolinate synthase